MVLTNAAEGSCEEIRVDDGGGSDDDAGSLSNRDDTTGRFPTNSRKPVTVWCEKPCDLEAQGKSPFCNVDDAEPVVIAHTSAGLTSSSVKMSLRSLRIKVASSGNLVVIASLSHACGTAGNSIKAR